LNLINKNNFKILKVDNGYGYDNFGHKHLYHFRKVN